MLKVCGLQCQMCWLKPAAGDTLIVVQDAYTSLVVVGRAFPDAFLYVKFVAVFSEVAARVLGECITESTGLIDQVLPLLVPK